MKRLRKSWLFWAAVMTLLLASLFISTTRAREDSGPEGFLALRRFIEGSGIEVRNSEQLPDRGSLVLIDDLRTGKEAAAVVNWVEKGGHLVLLQPSSETAELLGMSPGEQISPLGGDVRLRNDCLIPETSGVIQLAALGGDELMSSELPEAMTCLGREELGYLGVVDHGAGRAVVLGGRSAFTNEFLRQADNAVLAHRIFSRAELVTFGTALPPTVRQKSAWELLPLAAKLVMAQLIVAAIILAVVRGRRFGKPVLEEPEVVIPAGELVRASASLYRNAGASEFAGEVLRRSFVRRVGGRFAADRDDRDALVKILRANLSAADKVDPALTDPLPKTDSDLIDLGRKLEELEKELMKTL